jgi:acyl-coenzyme A synthetase/AMP-(fatty) acid ligase
VVLEGDHDDAERAKVTEELLQFCRGQLPAHKVPATIRIVSELTVGVTGKIARHRA